ncbi:MAG: uncharacterized protein JWP46_2024 [Modestobacter sp.]|nr:uncharacterized protein [Modestobacter sp.]
MAVRVLRHGVPPGCVDGRLGCARRVLLGALSPASTRALFTAARRPPVSTSCCSAACAASRISCRPRGRGHHDPQCGERTPGSHPGGAVAGPRVPAVLRARICQPGGMRPPRRAAAAVLAAAALVLAGCANSPGTADAAAGSAVSSSPSAGSTTPSAAPTGDVGNTDAPPSTTDLQPTSAEPVDAAGLTVSAVRVGRHEGFDRVVFELAGQGTPGWQAEYVDSATAEGTGEPVDLAGPSYLRVILRGTSYPYDSGAAELLRGPVPVSGTDTVTGVFYDGTFEGQSLAYVGTRAKAPFRVYALTGPTRVVVDVATS